MKKINRIEIIVMNAKRRRRNQLLRRRLRAYSKRLKKLLETIAFMLFSTLIN